MYNIKIDHNPNQFNDQRDLAGFFEVQNIEWTFDGINLKTGQTHTWRCRNAQKEGDFKKANKHLYHFL